MGDSAVTVKCVLAVKLISPKNEMQTDLRMTFTFVIILESFLQYVKNEYDRRNQFDLKNDRSSLKHFTVAVAKKMTSKTHLTITVEWPTVLHNFH